MGFCETLGACLVGGRSSLGDGLKSGRDKNPYVGDLGGTGRRAAGLDRGPGGGREASALAGSAGRGIDGSTRFDAREHGICAADSLLLYFLAARTKSRSAWHVMFRSPVPGRECILFPGELNVLGHPCSGFFVLFFEIL